jgi:hypothetical protein
MLEEDLTKRLRLRLDASNKAIFSPNQQSAETKEENNSTFYRPRSDDLKASLQCVEREKQKKVLLQPIEVISFHFVSVLSGFVFGS